MKIFLKISIVILVLLVVFSYATAMGRQPSEEEYLNKETIDFTLEDIDGAKVTLSDFKDKNNVMLFFWATWCHFCREEIVDLNSKHDELKQKEIVVLAIDVGEDRAVIKKFMANKPISYNILLDRKTKVAYSYDIVGVPTYILIDKKGSIKFVTNNFPENYEEIFSD